MVAYYNEIDPFAAAWLRELIKAGLIAFGDVDERSILDVRPKDLRGYTQCHFFAGIGVWSYALRRAGWPDDRPVWTGSCPCQPFSAAGKGAGFDDERHLWPHWFWLIGECRPDVVLGEQVASQDGLAWLDLVQADMEGAAYAVGTVDTCAAGFGAPHIRQRLYWVGERLAQSEYRGREAWQPRRGGAGSVVPSSASSGLADDDEPGQRVERGVRLQRPEFHDVDGRQPNGGMADADGGDAGSERQQRSGEQRQQPQDGGAGRMGHAEQFGAGRNAGAGVEAQGRAELWAIGDDAGPSGAVGRPGPTNGFWADVDWLFCRDGKWRPVEPGTFPLAHGAPARVGRLRGYGNAINAEQAQGFIEAYLETKGLIIEAAE